MAIPQEAQDQLLKLVKDEKHFTARWLRQAKEKTGLEEEHIAAGVAGLVAVCLVFAERGQVLCNVILVAVPLILSFVYLDEKPSSQHMTVYWSCFGLLTVLDGALEEGIPFYYIIKILILVLLFLKPYSFADKILEYTKKLEAGEKQFDPEKINELEKSCKGKKSPPPEKPEQEDQKIVKEKPADKANEPSSDVTTAAEPSVAPAPEPTPPALEAAAPPAPAQEPSSVAANTAAEPSSAAETAIAPASSGTSSVSVNDLNTTIRGTPRQGRSQVDEMANNISNFKLSTESDGEFYKNCSQPTAHNDFITEPMERMVFNAPYENVLSYYMTICNNSPRTMAFAIKSNAIPRITCNPPAGILKPRHKTMIFVNLQPFDFDSIDTRRDRIAFDYVNCPHGTKSFQHKLLQGDEPRRRKNIRIEYNP